MFGIGMALSALVCWALGDFYIQRTTRKIGDLAALFYIGALGVMCLLPFIWNEAATKLGSTANLAILLLTVAVTIFASLFDFEALKEGKLSVVEPVLSLELPFTIGLSMIFRGERISLAQGCLVLIIFLGIVLIVTKERVHFHHKRLAEKGVMLAVIGAMGMGLTNFITGYASQETSPLLTIWFVDLGLVLFCGLYLGLKGQMRAVARDMIRYPRLLLEAGIFDNLAWISFAYAVTAAPISIVTSISESYIGLAALLGVIVNHERLKTHQVVGIVLTALAVTILARLSE